MCHGRLLEEAVEIVVRFAPNHAHPTMLIGVGVDDATKQEVQDMAYRVHTNMAHPLYTECR